MPTPPAFSPRPVEGLELATTVHGDRVTLTLQGDIDMGSSARFESGLRDALGGGLSVELDMSGVSFMDSTGLRTLMLARAGCSVGQTITISTPSRPVQRLLEITGLIDILAVNRVLIDGN